MIISEEKRTSEEGKGSWQWDAPVMQTYDAVLSKIKELNLQGRIIKGFHTTGIAYNWRLDDIADSVHINLQKMIADNKISGEGPFPFLPEEVSLDRYAQIDTPFLIEFEDGDVFEIDFSDYSSVLIGMNSIPNDIYSDKNARNFHPDVLFESLIGREICAVDITTSTLSFFPCKYELGEQDAYISEISFVCKKLNSYDVEKLTFSSYYDYGIVALKDSRGVDASINASDVKKVVEGFVDRDALELKEFNYEEASGDLFEKIVR